MIGLLNEIENISQNLVEELYFLQLQQLKQQQPAGKNEKNRYNFKWLF